MGIPDISEFNLTPAAAEIFRKIYLQAVNKQIKFKHPEAVMVDQELWETLCFNFSLCAAFAYQGQTMIVDGIDLLPQKK